MSDNLGKRWAILGASVLGAGGTALVVKKVFWTESGGVRHVYGKVNTVESPTVPTGGGGNDKDSGGNGSGGEGSEGGSGSNEGGPLTFVAEHWQEIAVGLLALGLVIAISRSGGQAVNP